MLRLKSIFTLYDLGFFLCCSRSSKSENVHRKVCDFCASKMLKKKLFFYTLISHSNEESFGDLYVSLEGRKLLII